MNKLELIKKYKHTLTLKNYSTNTIDAYVNGLGIFLKYIQELLAHKHISTTQIYTHVSNRTMKDIKSPIEQIEL